MTLLGDMVAEGEDKLRITFLGTGIPNPDINAFGTSTLIEAGGQHVLLDCGRGAVIRLSQLGKSLGLIKKVFLSHFHSDHYAGLFDLLMTGTIPQPYAGRKTPLEVFGPVGVKDIEEGGNLVARPDRKIRTDDGEIDPDHMRIVSHDFVEGVVHDEDGLRIIAIEVDHGDFIKPAYAFRVEYGDHVFVHSHDTRYNENLISQAGGADVFVHEVAAARDETLKKHPGIQVALDHHATPQEVGRVFAQTRPKLAMLTHLVLLPPDPMPIHAVTDIIASEYDGTVLVAEDLMTIEIGRNITVIPFNHGRAGAMPTAGT